MVLERLSGLHAVVKPRFLLKEETFKNLVGSFTQNIQNLKSLGVFFFGPAG